MCSPRGFPRDLARRHAPVFGLFAKAPTQSSPGDRVQVNDDFVRLPRRVYIQLTQGQLECLSPEGQRVA